MCLSGAGGRLREDLLSGFYLEGLDGDVLFGDLRVPGCESGEDRDGGVTKEVVQAQNRPAAGCSPPYGGAASAARWRGGERRHDVRLNRQGMKRGDRSRSRCQLARDRRRRPRRVAGGVLGSL